MAGKSKGLKGLRRTLRSLKKSGALKPEQADAQERRLRAAENAIRQGDKDRAYAAFNAFIDTLIR